MNHACLTYMENGRRKIMVAGGVIKTSSGQNKVTNTVEVLDWNTKLWKYDRATPRRMTGRGGGGGGHHKYFVMFSQVLS